MSSRIDALRATIARLNDLYYNKGESDVDDLVYDSLKKELLELEGDTLDPNSPLNQVGSPSDGGFDKVSHASPMLSLQNAYNEEELTDWIAGLKYNPHVVLEPKLDGASLDLQYVNGKLKFAATRGDGEVGDDITDNALHFEGVPVDIGSWNQVIEVRGEVIVPHEHFKRACELREAQGKKPYANPRNMVAGLMRRKEGESLQGMGIRFITYEFIIHGEFGPTSIAPDDVDDHILDKFYLVDDIWSGPVEEIDKIMSNIDRVATNRDRLPYDIDGVVIKVLDSKGRARLGSRSTSPRWAIAYKFEAMTTTSVLESVEVQVGRTGVLTPVAKIRPVKLCGVTISSVTLHNFEEIERLGLQTLDTVIVSRRGDVIPKIEGVVTELRMDNHGVVKTPTKCPCCDSPVLKRGDSGVELFCTNMTSCPAQVIGRLAFYVSRDGVDVKNLGPSAIEALIAVGSLGSFSSLYHLGEQDFYAAGIGETMTDKIMAAIHRSKTLPFSKVLRAVGIPEVGDNTSRLLAERYHSFEELSKASLKELQEVDEVGATIACNIMTAFVGNGQDLLALDKNLTYTVPVIKKADVQDLLGKAVVVTGSSFDGLNRKEMEESVVSRGAKLSKGVSKNTDIVFAGAGAGPDKVKKALDLGFIVNGIEYINPKMEQK